jgi:hypothetical protein
MQKYFRGILALLIFISLPGYAGTSLQELAAKNQGKKLAIVSLSANNLGNSLQGWNSVSTSDLMISRMNKMLSAAEELFAQDWKLIKAKTFASKPEYQKLAGEQREVGLPKPGGHTMPLFSKNRKQLVKTQVDKDVAQSLAAATGGDFIMIIYSEWAVATGRFVPTSKPLTKNVVSIYDAKGKQVYNGRHDQMGTKTLGSLGNVVVNESTIDHWVDAYKTGLKILFDKGRKKEK